MATEELSYQVLEKRNGYEIRQYGPVIVAETMINESFENAGNMAFGILAGYIFGNNQSKTKISMTAPVSQTSSEKIAMTAPVNQKGSTGSYIISFTMPASYKFETLPVPNDSRVLLRQIEGRKLAVLRYAGTWSEENFQKRKILF